MAKTGENVSKISLDLQRYLFVLMGTNFKFTCMLVYAHRSHPSKNPSPRYLTIAGNIVTILDTISNTFCFWFLFALINEFFCDNDWNIDIKNGRELSSMSLKIRNYRKKFSLKRKQIILLGTGTEFSLVNFYPQLFLIFSSKTNDLETE